MIAPKAPGPAGFVLPEWRGAGVAGLGGAQALRWNGGVPAGWGAGAAR